jgi:tetratricopeptide (TPR) repeat protein
LEPGASSPSQLSLVQFLAELGRTHELVYLQPSFGYYFETFYPEPSGLVYLLKTYAPNMTDPPVPSAAQITQQTAYWQTLASGPLQELKTDLARLPADSRRKQDSDPSFIGTYYSRALNHWGFELQRAGRFEEAAPIFEQAIALNPDNASALINREMNASWRKDRTRIVKLSKEAEEKLGTYRAGLAYLLGTCGPIDEPSFAFEVASVFANGNLFRQAGQMIRRSLYYAPNEIYYHAALANLEILARQPDRALTLVSVIRTGMPLQTNAPSVQVEVSRVESVAHFVKNEFNEAERISKDSVQKFPEVDAAHYNLWRLYVSQADRVRSTNSPAAAMLMTNALHVVDDQLRLRPQNASAWFNHGNLCIYVNDYEGAIQSFTTVLQLQKDHSGALLNRAIVNLRSGKLDAAKKDYLAMLKLTTTSYQVYYGLGEIAYQQKNWREAQGRYEQYLRYASTATPGERESVRKRVEELKKK